MVGSGVGMVLEEVGPAGAGGVRRGRERQAVRPARVVKFVLSEAEYALVGAAATRLGLAHGAYAARAVLAVAQRVNPPMPDPLREALVELMRAGNQVRRFGVNLNQAVAALNAMGEEPGNLVPYASAAIRTVRKLDDLAESVRKLLR